MRISYITLHKVRNYGSVLQTYATDKLLKSIGHESQLIDYCSPRFVESNRLNDEFRRFKNPKKNNPIIKKLFYMIMSFSVKKQEKCFESFLEGALQTTKEYLDIEELRADPPIADIYCTGSDQVWNSKGNGFYERPFYLDFGDASVKRIAFAASFGRSQLDQEELDQIAPTLQRYYAIGVREMSGISILNELGINHSANVLDPTLMLTPKDWWDMTSENSPFKKKYILVYEFNKSSNIGRYARELSKKTGLPIKRVTYWYHERHKGEKCVCLPSVQQFLNLIRHAEYVITNSFHATVFSTVFQRKFAAVYPQHFSVRLDDYLRLLEITDRHIDSPDDIGNIENAIDYNAVNEKLQNARNQSLQFLQKAINGDF